MRTIHKFTMPSHRASFDMPDGAVILTAQMQDEAICLWAEVDTAKPKVSREFSAFGTGFRMPRDMGYSDRYVATVQDGPFVWHVYEVTGI